MSKDCDKHIECIQENISDFRQDEIEGCIVFSLGFTILSFTVSMRSVIPAIFAIIFMAGGGYLLLRAMSEKVREEKKLCELLNRRERVKQK